MSCICIIDFSILRRSSIVVVNSRILLNTNLAEILCMSFVLVVVSNSNWLILPISINRWFINSSLLLDVILGRILLVVVIHCLGSLLEMTLRLIVYRWIFNIKFVSNHMIIDKTDWEVYMTVFTLYFFTFSNLFG